MDDWAWVERWRAPAPARSAACPRRKPMGHVWLPWLSLTKGRDASRSIPPRLRGLRAGLSSGRFPAAALALGAGRAGGMGRLPARALGRGGPVTASNRRGAGGGDRNETRRSMTHPGAVSVHRRLGRAATPAQGRETPAWAAAGDFPIWISATKRSAGGQTTIAVRRRRRARRPPSRRIREPNRPRRDVPQRPRPDPAPSPRSRRRSSGGRSGR